MTAEQSGTYVPVRNWGSNVTHLADRPATAPAVAFGSPFTAVLLPAVMLCRAVLRGKAAVRMLPDDRHGECRRTVRCVCVPSTGEHPCTCCGGES
jgi:hypothetical protein